MRGLVHIHDTRNRGKNCKWETISGDLSVEAGRSSSDNDLRATLEYSRTHWGARARGGPRVAGDVPPQPTGRPATGPLWSAHTRPGRTVTSVGSLSSPFRDGKARLKLPPGKYWLGLRYYQWNRDAELPAVRADGTDVAKPTTVPADINGFYRDLGQRSNVIYLALHYYVFVLLRYRRWFPASFVQRKFLPMGNPETKFYFEALGRENSSNCASRRRRSTAGNTFNLIRQGQFPDVLGPGDTVHGTRSSHVKATDVPDSRTRWFARTG